MIVLPKNTHLASVINIYIYIYNIYYSRVKVMLDIYAFNPSIDSLLCGKLEINNKRLTRQVQHETKISPYISRKSTH